MLRKLHALVHVAAQGYLHAHPVWFDIVVVDEANQTVNIDAACLYHFSQHEELGKKRHFSVGNQEIRWGRAGTYFFFARKGWIHHER
jgi:hypothetical protein